MDEHIGKLNRTLAQIAGILNAGGVTWWLGASTSLFVQGVNVVPKDLDIIVDISQFDQALALLADLQPSQPVNGEFVYEPYRKSDLMGAEFPTEVVGFEAGDSGLLSVKLGQTDIFVLPLETELEMYRKRPDKQQIVSLIEATLRNNQKSQS